MAAQVDALKEKLRQWTILLGVFQVTVGCLVGFIPPTAVQYFRGIVMAHIEFAMNGILMIALGFLVRELRLNPLALKIWFVLLQIGTWTNGGAGVIMAFTGATTKLAPTMTEKFPPPNGDNSGLVTATLMVCGVTILAALIITLYGLWRTMAAPKNMTA